MPSSCLSCQKSSSSPLNFLLNCISCPNSWHHRCHSPPISDKELISIIKAFNAEKHNPDAKLIWKCGICVKAKNQVASRLIAVKKVASPRHITIPFQKAIVIDEEIVTLDGPPEVSECNGTGVSHSQRQRPLTTQDTLSHPKRQSSPADSSDQLNVQPAQGRTSNDKIIRIIDDPFLVRDPSPSASKLCQTSSSNKPQVIPGLIDLTISSDEEVNNGGDDKNLEHLTPPPKPASTSKQIVEKVPLILTSNQTLLHSLPRDARSTAHTSTMTTSSQPPNQLLIQWLNNRSTAAGVKPDIWARTRLRQDQYAANRRSIRNKESFQQFPSVSPSPRKCKAHRLNEGPHTHSRASFFLSAEEWLREKHNQT